MSTEVNDVQYLDTQDFEEIVEEALIHVTVDNADEISILNVNSNVRVLAVDSETPVLQIENKIFHFNEWKYITGTAMFFERKNEVKKIDPLYDNRCGTVLQYIGSTRKCLEMTKKENMNTQ
ncbi:general transcription factor 3C polypeptide 6 isoform X1 [Rhopalosiphum maidis]|uniref:general transcription factor 3C polypeptide 6 isoform X1 n=1 Tax=Rhopalosiphum maidis TaxID=43146 RepID=UPI000F00FF2C|nr:general transcription factor 3C polypeptide 6 isoform X1 [Rhopalosiphum maidis]